VIEKDRITDIHIHYAENYHEQMLNYSKNYSFLPVENVEL
jgi:hypothetical protein